MSEPTKHKFYYGEETYTICVTKDEFFFMSECEKIEAAIQAEQKKRGLE